MSFTDRMVERAYYLLHKFGRAMTMQRTIAGAYDPATQTTAADTVIKYPCYGFTQFITRTSANQFYGTSTLQASLIQKDDEMCFLSGKDIPVMPTHPIDKLIISGLEYNVMFCTPLKSGATDVLYVLQIRK